MRHIRNILTAPTADAHGYRAWLDRHYPEVVTLYDRGCCAPLQQGKMSCMINLRSRYDRPGESRGIDPGKTLRRRPNEHQD